MKFDPITKIDLKEIKKLQPEGWRDIIPDFELYIDMPFCFPLKVSIGRKPVGIGTAINYGKTAWLAHIIVDAEQRKKGIGSAIVDHLLERLNKSGCETVTLIATDLGYPIYLKAGFTDETEYAVFERNAPLRLQDFPDNIIRISNKDLNALYKLDEQISGENRKNLLNARKQGARIYRNGDRVTGYYLPELGEGLIAAEEEEAAIELMKVKFYNSTKGVIPALNSAGINFYLNNGFKEIKRIKRMVYGKKLVWHPERLYSRAGGNLG